MGEDVGELEDGGGVGGRGRGRVVEEPGVERGELRDGEEAVLGCGVGVGEVPVRAWGKG